MLVKNKKHARLVHYMKYTVNKKPFVVTVMLCYYWACFTDCIAFDLNTCAYVYIKMKCGRFFGRFAFTQLSLAILEYSAHHERKHADYVFLQCLWSAVVFLQKHLDVTHSFARVYGKHIFIDNFSVWSFICSCLREKVDKFFFTSFMNPLFLIRK